MTNLTDWTARLKKISLRRKANFDEARLISLDMTDLVADAMNLGLSEADRDMLLGDLTQMHGAFSPSSVIDAEDADAPGT